MCMSHHSSRMCKIGGVHWLHLAAVRKVKDMSYMPRTKVRNLVIAYVSQAVSSAPKIFQLQDS